MPRCSHGDLGATSGREDLATVPLGRPTTGKTSREVQKADPAVLVRGPYEKSQLAAPHRLRPDRPAPGDDMTQLWSATTFGCPVAVLLWTFIAYSFVGVVVEGLYFLAREGVLESRTGLLYLPLRPLYGVGGLTFAVLLRPLAAHPVLVFVLGAVLASLVEYLAGLVVERLFDAVSWDYSHHRLNLHGRICLATRSAGECWRSSRSTSSTHRCGASSSRCPGRPETRSSRSSRSSCCSPPW